MALHIIEAALRFVALSEHVAVPSRAVHMALPPPSTFPVNVNALGPPETVPIKSTDVTDHVQMKTHCPERSNPDGFCRKYRTYRVSPFARCDAETVCTFGL